MRNYDTKLSGEIMTQNYEVVYYVAQNVGIIGILAYPKIGLNMALAIVQWLACSNLNEVILRFYVFKCGLL